MVKYPQPQNHFLTPEELKGMISYSQDNNDESESLFDLITKLFPEYHEQHPERPMDINLQTFLLGFADFYLVGVRLDEQ